MKSSASSSNEPVHWTYEDDAPCGPNKWPAHFPTGKNQSPINIVVGPNCDQLVRCTCCAGVARHLSELRVSDASPSQDKAPTRTHARRSHLDSQGSDERVPSTSPMRTSSSASSSAGSSSARDDDDDDDDELDDGFVGSRGYNKHARKHTHTQPLEQVTRYCTSNKKMFLGYPRYLHTAQLCNTGHGWQLNIPNELACHTLLCGPPLGDREYRLAQLHCHWGEDCDTGSEHQINGRSYSAEIHFVHWNCKDYDTIEEASKHRDGLAVLGVFVQALEGEQHRHKHLDKIIAGLKRIHKPGSSTTLHARLDLKKLFPANRWVYATYHGSLTTPPLTEVVDWVVFLSPIQCSTAQIEQFRRLRCPAPDNASAHDHLRRNCRPVQPTNGRTVTIWTHH